MNKAGNWPINSSHLPHQSNSLFAEGVVHVRTAIFSAVFPILVLLDHVFVGEPFPD